MDIIDVNMAASKAAQMLGDSGAVGYAEQNVLTFDGDTTGKHAYTTSSGVKYVHISDEVIDANAITKIVALFGGVAYEGTNITVGVSDPSAGLRSVGASFGGTTLYVVYVAENDYSFGGVPGSLKKGVSVLCDPDGSVMGIPMWVSLIETETIHPIDPKYLPDAVVPKVIDLTKYVLEHPDYGAVTFSSVALDLFAKDGGSHVLTDNSTFWSDLSTDRPLRFVFDCEALAPGIKIEADAKSGSLYDGTTFTVETSFLVILDLIGRVTVLFQNNFDGTTTITVVVEPLTTPGA